MIGPPEHRAFRIEEEFTTNFAQELSAAVADGPDRPAVRLDDLVLSYAFRDLSETTGMGSFDFPDRERKSGSIGLPIGGTEFRLVDDEGADVPAGEPGEIVMRGPFVMQGYWGREDATRDPIRDGWFHTGDMATVDDDGYYFIVDRIAAYEYPRRVWFVDELPKGPTGKVLEREIEVPEKVG